MKNMLDGLFESEKKDIVKCLCEAVGDDLKACLRRENINDKRSNGKKLIKWDFVNRNLIRRFKATRLSAKYARRGAWYMVPLFDRENGYLYTIMREDRFVELQKKQDKRSKAHYLDALVQSFNIDLDNISQIRLFDKPQFEEEEIKKIVSDILNDFEVEASFIRRHAVILFEEYNSEITAIRCCILDNSLQIVEEVDWSQYITNNESVVVEVINENEKNMPQLTLKPKAKEKIGQRDLVAMKKANKELEKENV